MKVGLYRFQFRRCILYYSHAGEIPNVLHEIVKSGKAVSPSKNPSPYGFADLEKECYSFYPEERPLFAGCDSRLYRTNGMRNLF